MTADKTRRRPVRVDLTGWPPVFDVAGLGVIQKKKRQIHDGDRRAIRRGTENPFADQLIAVLMGVTRTPLAAEEVLAADSDEGPVPFACAGTTNAQRQDEARRRIPKGQGINPHRQSVVEPG